MKLIHCADLHLDSPMTARLSDQKSRLRREEIRQNFRRLVEEGAANGVGIFLIAGDLFDEKTPTKKSRKYVLDVISSHPDLLFYYLSGNHDGKETLQEVSPILPANLFLFDEGWTTYTPAPGLTITGSTKPDAETLDALPTDSCNILMLHGQVANGVGRPSGELLYLDRYKEKNLDYLALGHLHSYSEERLDPRAVYCYSGCLEGRGFDECGDKGYILLETEGNTLSRKFVPFAKRRIHRIECDVTDCTSALELEERIDRAVANISEEDYVRVIFSGSYLPDSLSTLTPDDHRLSERFFYGETRNEAKLKLRREDYEKDISLKGEFVRTVLNDVTLTPELAEQVILCGLRALTGEEPIL